jgi:hypothetical protein
MSALEILNQWFEHMRELNAWPAQIQADGGSRYDFAGVDENGRGMYGGMSGFPFSKAEARWFAVTR